LSIWLSSNTLSPMRSAPRVPKRLRSAPSPKVGLPFESRACQSQVLFHVTILCRTKHIRPTNAEAAMRVVRAEVLGMCFGVKDALSMVNQLDRPEHVTILGELVHNESVNATLRRRGFRTVGERDRDELPGTELVLVTAHGISATRRASLEHAG